MSKLFGKKLLCGLLAFALVLGYFPGAVFAAEAEETEETEVTAPPIAVQADTLNASYVAGGMCGYYSDVSWSLYSDGTLTISGTGEMAINKEEGAPWYDYASDITSVVIKSGVTDIEGFEDCVNLTSVSIADTVTQIWGAAFSGCTSLPEITIPDHVTYIGGYAFSGCSSLTGITIPASVVNIGESAFTSCDSLTGIWVDEGNQNYTSDASGVLFNKEKTTLLQAPGSIRGTYSVPDGVTAIQSNAFYGCKRLTGVTIPSSVTGIGYSAFRDCVSLTDVTIPYRVTTIDSFTFSGCTSLSAITIPMSVTRIAEGAFASCGALREITFFGSAPRIEVGSQWYTPAFSGVTATAYYPADNATWTADKMQDYGGTITWKAAAEDAPGSIIASGACGENLTWTLTDTGKLTISGTGAMTDYSYSDSAPWSGMVRSVEFKASVTRIGAYAFYNCESLSKITLPDSVTSIGRYAFSNTGYCYNVENWENDALYLGNFILELNSDYYGRYYVKEGTKYIADHAFYGCRKMSGIILPDSVVGIGSYAFDNCQKLTSITLPDSVTSIGDGAFNNCRYLNKINIPEGVTSIGEQAFAHCYSLTNVVLPNSVTSIGSSAFYYCSSLSSITLPDSVTGIGDYAFSHSGLKEITFAGNAPAISEDAFYYVTATAYYPGDDATWTADVMQNYGGTITWEGYICDHTWGQWAAASDPTCTAGGTEARVCTSCGKVETRTVSNALGHAYESVVTDPTCTEQGYTTHTCTRCDTSYVDTYVDALGHKTELKNAKEATCTEDGYTGDEICTVCGETVEKGKAIAPLGHAYEHGFCIRCGKLESIASGKSGENLTWELTGDGTLTISGTGDMADYDYGEVPWFDYLDKITVAVVETGVTSIGDYAFHYCESLTEITLPDSLTRIGKNAFCSCNGLTGVTLPDSLTEIADYGFSWCAGLTEIAIPDSVSTIGESAFIGCSSLKGIWVSEGNPNYASDRFGALLNKEKTTLIQCPGGIEKTYPVSDGVTVIGSHAFDGCTGLTAVAIPDSVTEIGPGAFVYCSSLTGIIIPDSVTSIGASAFYCTGLTSITLPDSVTGISDYLFYYCANLTEVTIPDSVTSIGVSAFEFCASLTEITLPESLTSIASGAFFSSRLTDITIPAGVTAIGECAFAYSANLAEITFMGSAPAIGEDAFLDVTAIAYYPMGDATWTESVMQNYGGTITWKAVCIDHQWGEWVITTEPTCTEAGEETRTCSVCGATETREMAALGHKLTPVAGKEADFTVPGMKAHYVCEVCGKLFADEAGTVEVTAEELVIPQLIQVENGKTEIGKEVIDSAAENVEHGGEVKLPVADAGEVKRAELPVQSLTQVADKEASLTVEMTAATVTMDNAALEAVARQSGEQDAVTLEITEIPKEDLTEAQQEAVKDKNVVNTISARLLVNDQPIASEADGGFGDGRVTVKIPFTPEAGTTAADYKVLYVADDGTTAEIPTTYEDGCLVIVLEHFSDYVIVKTKTVTLGDINGDGKITVTDLMCLANHLAGKAEINEANSDLDGNGKVTVTDLMRLANVFAGKATLG